MSRVHSYLNELEADSLIAKGKYQEALGLLLASLEKKDFIDRENVYQNIAVCYMVLKDYEKDRDYLQRLLELRPSDTDTQYNLAYCYYSLKDYDRAAELFEDLKKKEGVSSDVSYNLGLVYLGKGLIDRAMQNFVCLLDQSASSSLINNAGLNLVTDHPEKAKDIFIRYLKENPGDIDATFGLGMAYSKLGEQRKSIECLQRVIDWDAHRYQSAYVSLAMEYFQIGELKLCMKQLETAIQLNPMMAEAWFYLGFVYETGGNTGQAVASYVKAGEIDRKMVEVWDRLGRLYLKLEKMEEARISFKKALLITGKKSYAFKIGLIYLSEKNHREALGYFLDCLTSSGNEDFQAVDIYENLAICFYNLENYEKAAEWGRKASDLGRDRTILLFILGSSYLKLGITSQAEEFLNRGLQKDPSEINILYCLGILEGNRENYLKAKDYLKKALIIQRNPDIIYALALTEMKLKNRDAAAQLFAEYQESRLSDADVLYKLGLIFIELKKTDLAKKAFRDTLKLRPENKKAKEYLLSLK